MARHNRETDGTDQHGLEYAVSYQPDWLRQVKVTRRLETGRQSTKTLFTNPDAPVRAPGQQVRTAIRCKTHDVAFEIAVTDPGRVVKRIVVEMESAEGDVQFTIDGRG